LASGKSVVYSVTFQVEANVTYAAIGAFTEDNGYDPDPPNNAAINTIQLVPNQHIAVTIGRCRDQPATALQRQQSELKKNARRRQFQPRLPCAGLRSSSDRYQLGNQPQRSHRVEILQPAVPPGVGAWGVVGQFERAP
jgi:hypothetical protein